MKIAFCEMCRELQPFQFYILAADNLTFNLRQNTNRINLHLNESSLKRRHLGRLVSERSVHLQFDGWNKI